MVSLNRYFPLSACWGLLIIFSGTAVAYQDDIDHTKLVGELGVNTPNGSGVLVCQIEADTSGSTGPLYAYSPDPANIQFTGKNITDVTDISSGYSSHATSVGVTFYGTDAIASGITNIHNYLAYSPVQTGDTPIYDNWLQANYLYWGSTALPLASAERIANHSWVGNTSDSTVQRRVDWVVQRDEFVQVVGTKNGTGLNQSLLSSAFNVIPVGRTDGLHGTGTPALDAIYTAGRQGVGVVAPRSTTSAATPVVSSTIATLMETAHQGGTGLSNGSTSNRNGDTIFNAERSETLRAAIYAGADRITNNTTSTANITDYRANTDHQAANGMDTRFGAGQVNAYNSYHIIAAGEQDSEEDGTTGDITAYGFDYDPNFGGANGTNDTASYYFSTGSVSMVLRASLVWNIKIEGGNRTFDDTATLYDLDLVLYDITGTATFVASSDGIIDNSENVWLPLQANRQYLLQVITKGSSTFNWDYALAWVIENDTDNDMVSDGQDNCVGLYNPDQADMDADTTGDVCDADIDGDGVNNVQDAFPYDPAETLDTDSDGVGNNADTDDDNDGLLDVDEALYGTDPLLSDTDSDGFSDYEEIVAGTDPTDSTSFPMSANGDLNGDSIVDVRDVLLGQRILSGMVTATEDQMSRGDVAPLILGLPSPDGAFNVGDIVVITRKAMGAIDF